MKRDHLSWGIIILVTGFFFLFGISSTRYSAKCKEKGCYQERWEFTSYDEGYEDVYLNDDYDWERYYRDDDYAVGVDDAMDELDW